MSDRMTPEREAHIRRSAAFDPARFRLERELLGELDAMRRDHDVVLAEIGVDHTREVQEIRQEYGAAIAELERERDEALAHGDKLASRNRTLAEHLAKREQGIDGLCMGIARLISRNAALVEVVKGLIPPRHGDYGGPLVSVSASYEDGTVHQIGLQPLARAEAAVKGGK